MSHPHQTPPNPRLHFASLLVAVGLLMPGAPSSAAPPPEKVPVAGPNHDVVTDVVFLPAAREERLDLYLPKDKGEKKLHPAVVLVHGGGWGHRRRREAIFVKASTNLAESGFVTACIEYEIAPPDQLGVSYIRNMGAAFPQNVQDVKSAVRFLRKNAAKYGIDANRIAVAGTSAGGHLAALAAVTQPQDGLEPKDDGHGEVSSAVQACISYYGIFDFSDWGFKKGQATEEDTQKGRLASPIQYVDKADPPILLFHGTKDRTVPFKQSERMVAKLTEAGVANELVPYPERDHSVFHLSQKTGVEDLALTMAFIEKHTGGAVAPKP